MTQDNGLGHTKPIKRCTEEIGLGLRAPHPAAWPRAVPIAGTVEHHDPVLARHHPNQSAGEEVLDHAAIAMQQNQRRSLATLQVMEGEHHPRR